MTDTKRQHAKIKHTIAEHLIPETAEFGEVFCARDTGAIWYGTRSGVVVNLTALLNAETAYTPVRHGKDAPPAKDGVRGERGERGADGCAGAPGKDGVNAVGIAGPQGRAGRDAIDGKNGVGFRWRGQWREDERYFVNDVTRHYSSAWICTHDTDKHQQPPSTDNHDFELFAAGGQDGRDGEKGATGDVQVIGADEAQVELQKLRQARAASYARIVQAIIDNDSYPNTQVKAMMKFRLQELEKAAR